MKYFFSCLTYFFLVFGQLLLLFNIYMSLFGYRMKHSFSWCLYYRCVVYVALCKEIESYFELLSSYLSKYEDRSLLYSSGQQKQKQRLLQQKDKKGQAQSLTLLKQIRRLIFVIVSVYPQSTQQFLRTNLDVTVRYISNWTLKELILRRRENLSSRRKTSQSKGENQQQTKNWF